MSDETVFTTALAITDSNQRAKFLDEACANDLAQRHRVERLLAAHAKSDSAFLEHAPPELNHTTSAIGQKESDDDQVQGVLAYLQASPRPDSLGRIGHYDVLQVLGRGGFGVVFRAFDDVLQRVVALKVLSAHMAVTSPARKRFLREARASAAIRHDNVVQVHAVEEQPLPYLVMEFIPGETLQQRITRTGPLDTPQIVEIGRQIAEGLAAAHAQGLIHRDIKPANVLIESGIRERVKITDFGLARTADDATATQSGIIGTPLFMAPEQANGESLDHRADLFSLGSVLYAMCTGHSPFRATSTLAVLRRVSDDTPRPIRELIPETPQWLCDIITKLLAKKPEDRYQTAREVAELLAHPPSEPRAARTPNVPSESRASRESRDPVEETLDFIDRPTQRPQAHLRARNRRWLWIVACAVPVCVGLVFAIQSFNKSKPNPDIAKTDNLNTPEDPKLAPPPREKPTPPEVKPPAAGDGSPDRKAMEYVFSLGGHCILRDGKQRYYPKTPKDFPEEFVLTALVFQPGEKRITDEGLAVVAGCKSLEAIVLPSQSPITDVGLAHFKDAKKISQLAIPNLPITDNGLKQFADCKELISLDLSYTKITDAGLANFRDCRQLRTLKLGGTVITSDGLKGVLQQSLQSVDLQRTTVKDDAVMLLKDLPNLQHLNLQDTNVTDATLTLLANHKKLEVLTVRGTKVTAKGIEELQKAFPKCKIHWDGGTIEPLVPANGTDPDRKAAEYVLSIGGSCDVETAKSRLKVWKIDELPLQSVRLYSISINDLATNKFTNDGLKIFAGLTDLEFVQITQVPLTDDGLAHFKQPQKIKELYLSSTKITDQALTPFCDSLELRVVDLERTGVTDRGVAVFKNCQKLTSVNLERTKITDEAIKSLPKTTLTTLKLAWTSVGDESVLSLKGSLLLVWIDLTDTRVTDRGLNAFQQLRNLNVVVLRGTAITDAGLDNFKGHTKIKQLYLSSTDVSDTGIKAFQDCAGLSIVDLRSTRITDEGLKVFHDKLTLNSLDVRNTKVTAKGVEELRKLLPKCKIHWDGDKK